MCNRLFIFAALVLFVSSTFSNVASGQSFAERTSLLDIRMGGDLNDIVRDISRGRYELSDGTPVHFRDWYNSRWTNLEVDFLTQISDDFGILWGVGTGERGKKYRIKPSVRLGAIKQFRTSEYGYLTFQATVTLGGDLKEKACIADYGEIGGVQKVNCRLAASPLPPKETLPYLLDEEPYDAIFASINYALRF